MAYKDADVENFRTLFAPRVAALRGATMAGVDVRLHVWPEMPHDWPLFHQIIRAGVAAIDRPVSGCGSGSTQPSSGQPPD